MRNLIFVVENAIYENDGYKSRIEMEMDLLKEHFKFFMIVPRDSRRLSFRNEVTVIVYEAFNKNVPFLLNYISLNRCMRKLLSEISNPLVVGEALPSTVAIRNICRRFGIQYVFDCHGTAPDEAYLCNKNIIGFLYKIWLKRQEKRVVNECNLIITVSNRQFKYFKSNKKHVLLPMLPSKFFLDDDDSRVAIRNELGIPMKGNVFVYSGQNQKWQMSNETICFYNKIKKMDNNAYLVIYTNQVEEFRQLCEENKTVDYVIKQVEYKEMSKYLDVGDFGFCLRKNHIINLVASPTKVLEYLSRGLTPIITEYVGDFSQSLVKANLAIVINDFENIKPDQFFKIDRKEAKRYLERFSSKLEKDYIEAMTKL